MRIDDSANGISGNGIERHDGSLASSVRSYRWQFVFAMVAGLLLRLWFIFRHEYISGDSLVYGDLARNLLEHHVYGLSVVLDGVAAPPRPTLIRLPGYPLFLALCFRLFGIGRYLPVLLVQAVVDLGTCGLIAALAKRIFGRRAVPAALWLSVLCPFTANYVAAPLTETLTLFCIALAFYSLSRWEGALGQGGRNGLNGWFGSLAFALAFAILLRPEQGLLAVAIVPAFAWALLRRASLQGGRVWVPVLLLVVLVGLPLVPWTARNWITFHVIQPLAPRFAMDPGELNPTGFQRWYRTWAVDFISTDNVYWSYDGHVIEIGDLPSRAFDSPDEYAATEALLRNYNEDQNPTPALDSRFAQLAAERIQANPFRYYFELPVARVLDMVLRPRTEMLPVPLDWWRFREHRTASFFALSYALLNLAFFCLAGRTLRRREMWKGDELLVVSMLSMMLLRFALLLTLDNSEPRYTLEFFPVVIVLAAAAFGSEALEEVRRSS